MYIHKFHIVSDKYLFHSKNINSFNTYNLPCICHMSNIITPFCVYFAAEIPPSAPSPTKSDSIPTPFDDKTNSNQASPLTEEKPFIPPMENNLPPSPKKIEQNGTASPDGKKSPSPEPIAVNVANNAAKDTSKASTNNDKKVEELYDIPVGE